MPPRSARILLFLEGWLGTIKRRVAGVVQRDREGQATMSTTTHGPNDALRYQRRIRGWSLRRVADGIAALCIERTGKRPGVNADMVGEWERGVKKPSPFYQEMLCLL